MLLIDLRMIASLPAGLADLAEILVGFAFVIVVLGILAGVTEMIGFVFKYLARRRTSVAAAASALADKAQAAGSRVKLPPADDGAGDIPPEVLVVIAAAVHVALKRPHRIVSIKPADSHQWAAEGRREIARSHRLR